MPKSHSGFKRLSLITILFALVVVVLRSGIFENVASTSEDPKIDRSMVQPESGDAHVEADEPPVPRDQRDIAVSTDDSDPGSPDQIFNSYSEMVEAMRVGLDQGDSKRAVPLAQQLLMCGPQLRGLKRGKSQSALVADEIVRREQWCAGHDVAWEALIEPILRRAADAGDLSALELYGQLANPAIINDWPGHELMGHAKEILEHNERAYRYLLELFRRSPAVGAVALAGNYASGQFTPKNAVDSYYWARVANINGGRINAESMARLLSAEQIAEAEQRVRSYQQQRTR